MKFLFLFLILRLQCQQQSSIISDYLFGYQTSDVCNIQNNCFLVKKFKAIFPQDNQEAPSDLNVFSTKTIYLYNDHISVYKDIPNQQINDMPKQSDFLNNYPLNSFIPSCQNQICTLKDFMVYHKEISEKKFTMNEQVMIDFGILKTDYCLILVQDLLVQESYIYVCSEDLKDVLNLKLRIDENKNKLSIYETVSKISLINEDYSDFDQVYLHFNQEQLVVNNSNEELKNQQTSDDYKVYLSLQLDQDFFYPAAQMISLKKPFQWKIQGENSVEKPDYRRCFKISIKNKSSQGLFNMKYKIFCIFGSADGSQPYSTTEAQLVANQWVTQINKQISLKSQAQFRQVLDKFVSTRYEDFLEIGRQVQNYVKFDLNQQAILIERVCDILVTFRQYEFKECESAKQKAIVDLMSNICKNNKGCIKYLAKNIESGKLPLSIDQNTYAWNLDNPYIQLDIVNSQIIDQTTKMTHFNARQQKIINLKENQKTYDLSQNLDGVSTNFNERPTDDEVFKMVNTIQQIFQGNDIDDLASLNGDLQLQNVYNPVRALSILPFTSQFDPWTEYLGYMKDTILGG